MAQGPAPRLSAGERLRALRLRAGVTASRLAGDGRRQTVHEVERQHTPSPDATLAYLQALERCLLEQVEVLADVRDALARIRGTNARTVGEPPRARRAS